jgi:hypothetical protein
MFGELPAWGLFIRHAKNIDISGLTLTVAKKDFRTAVVFDNVQNAKFTNLIVKEPEKKAISYTKRSTGITINNQPVK